MKEEIKEGYKKTEIGVIPEDWEVKRLGELGLAYNGLSGKNKDDFGRGKLFIPYKNIFNNSKIDINYLENVVIKENENQNKVKYGDIFFTTSSETPEEVGMSSVILDEVDELYLNSFCFGFRLNDFSTLLPEFARFLFRGSKIRKIISKLAQGSTRFNLSKSQLLKINIPIPPLSEQQKIASILSTVDEFIEQIDKLIEKTKELKKGLMQKLLTKGIGHTEFKKTEIGEIPKEWEVKRLEKYIKIRSGYSPKNFELNVTGKYPFYKVDDLNYTPKYLNKSKFYFNKCSYPLMPKGMVVFPKRGAAIFTNKVAILEKEGYFDTNIMGLICKKGLNNEYLFYQISFLELKKFADTTAIPQINNKHVNPLKIPLPPLSEQQKIASILSEVDNKIEQYELKKEKLQILKKGLMQKLLTGKIRVKVYN